jgi:hypothetical protein
MTTFVRITQDEMLQSLEEAGGKWFPLTLPRTLELVYGRRVDKEATPLTLRIYTSLNPDGIGRDCGRDAIRVQLFTKITCEECRGSGITHEQAPTRACTACKGEKFVMRRVGASKRVNRTLRWQHRLVKRIKDWEKCLQQRCPECQSLMTERTGFNGGFYGCIRYPYCRGTING